MGFDKDISLSNLAYYDQQLKKWIVEKLPAKSSELVFDDRDNFPAKGKENLLYIAKDTIYKWDSENNTYVNACFPKWEDI